MNYQWACVGAFALLHSIAITVSILKDAPSVDEVGHLAAGITHWRAAELGLYAVNPPLVRLVSTVPVSLTNFNPDWRRYNPEPLIRAEFHVGQDFMVANGQESFKYFTIARWACLPFSLLGILICFLWARELYGEAAGLVAASLWAFSPNILASAGMITPDCGAAAMGLAACYLFWRWLKDPTAANAFFTGIVLGLAELTKFTWIILFPLWLLLWIVYRSGTTERNWWNESGQVAFMFLLAVYVINAGYGYEGSFTKLKNFEFVSETLGGASDAREAEKGNRFRDSFLGEVPVPVPKNYLLGIDVQKRDFERGIRSYLRGEWKHGGWWYYYLYALLVKVPIGTWALFLLAVYATLRYPSVNWQEELVLLAPAIVVITLVSSQTGFNHHLRYILPAFPFGFIFIGKVGAYLRWPRTRPPESAEIVDHNNRPGLWFTWAVAIALLCSVGSSLRVYPHSMSYFNELAGGPLRGHEHLLDSNIDWGQDLLYLKDWYDEHPEARPFHLAYFGGFDPHVAGFEYELPAEEPTPGWHAVSVNLMRGFTFGVYDHRGRKQFAGEDRFTYFQQFEPVARAGYSIYIYHITDEDIERVRNQSESNSVPASNRE